MQKPTIFVGSSTEGLEFARAIRSLLQDEAELTLWNEGFFGVGNVFVDTLITGVGRFDFAVLVLTPDDLVQSRNAESFGPRDNLLFDLGLFMGRLERKWPERYNRVGHLAWAGDARSSSTSRTCA